MTQTKEHPVRTAQSVTRQAVVLAVIEGPDPHAVYRLTAQETVIGRGDDKDIDIDDNEVSNRHCMIRVDGSICTLVELGSLNGTLVNGRSVRAELAQRIRHLDEIQVGSTRLLLLTGRFARRPQKI